MKHYYVTGWMVLCLISSFTIFRKIWIIRKRFDFKFATGTTTQAELGKIFAAGVVDTGGKFAAGVVDTGGSFATGVVDTIRIRIQIGIKTMSILESGSYSKFFTCWEIKFKFISETMHARTFKLETYTRAYRHEDPPRSYGASLWSSEGPNDTESWRLSVKMLRIICCTCLYSPRQASKILAWTPNISLILKALEWGPIALSET